MQGRLSPPEGDEIQAFPRARWREEFEAAREAGLSGIEWIYDVHGEDVNPLATDDGLTTMAALADRSGVEVDSLCADWFMERRLACGDEATRAQAAERLKWLLERCGGAGIRRVVLPFVDASSVAPDEARARAREAIAAGLPAAERADVELHLETDLPPAAFARFLEELPSPRVKVNYDTGNSASLGYDPVEEIAAYGERIGSVHVKDRVRGGATVPLGSGDADLSRTFRVLRELGYDGDLILQVARSEPGGEVEWARRNRELVERTWAEASP